MNLSIFGLGYVGSVSCACLGKLGHTVIGTDVVESKVERLGRGEPPILEEGLAPIVKTVIDVERLKTTLDPFEAVAGSQVAIICVGTPSTISGGVNSLYLERVCEQIGKAVAALNPNFYTVINRSTCLPTIHSRLQEILSESSKRKLGDGIGYVCHPEFLREGTAVKDFFHPPKIVFGPTDPKSAEVCQQLYPGIEAETFFLTPQEAAMVKYADNCFHALKVTFANELGLICKPLGVDSHAVMNVFCRDRKLNISEKYLRPGLAFGGSCLPKDLRGLLDGARETATPLHMLSGIVESNRVQIDHLLRRILSPKRPTVGIVGLAFKEGTDDVRESPMVTLVENLCGKGHPVLVYDEHLAMQRLEESNLSYVLQSIPHLSDLLTQDLQDMVNRSVVVVISHRLHPEKWRNISWRSNQTIIDLVNIPELTILENYEGLYW